MSESASTRPILLQNKTLTAGEHLERKKNALLSSEMRGFTGETLDLGAVLGLFSEKLDKSVSFDKFTDFIKNYMLKNYKNTEDIVCLIVDLEDPTTVFEANNAPEDLLSEEEKYNVKVKLWEMKIRRYLNRENTLKGNIM